MSAPVSTIRRLSLLAVALLLLSSALAACGGGSSNDNSSTSGGASTSAPSSSSSPSTTGASGAGALDISATETGGLGFSQRTLTARSGEVTITLDNGSGNALPHAIAIEGNGVDKDGATVQPGDRSTVTVRLKPGRYTFYCPVDGHEDQGMKGTLTVS
jgi:uncharacterized cupredoxin-like copper-binding protein